jgi:nucleoid DNA-binding protein
MAKAKGRTAATKTRTKSEIFGALAENAGVTRKQVAAMFDGLGNLIKRDLARGPGMFTLPGLMKITIRRKPAQKAIRNWRNPFTGELQTKPARPASKVVKIRPLKKLKEMV